MESTGKARSQYLSVIRDCLHFIYTVSQMKAVLRLKGLFPFLSFLSFFLFYFYHFESFHSRDVQEGDGGEVQDQAVEVHSGNADVSGKLGVPVHPERKAPEVSGQI